MLTFLLATGVLGAELPAGSAAIVATPECTVTPQKVQATTALGVGVPLGANKWPQALDPGDHVPYAVDFSALLGAERVADIESIRMPASGALLGVRIDQAAGFAPVIDDDAGKKVQVWFHVDTEFQDAAAFEEAGVQLPVAFRVRTNGTPAQRLERTSVLIVRQQ